MVIEAPERHKNTMKRLDQAAPHHGTALERYCPLGQSGVVSRVRGYTQR